MANKLGCAPIAAIIVLVVLLVFFGANAGVGFYYTQCDEEDSNFFSCFFDELAGDEEEEGEPEEGTVTAAGAYEYKGYAVTFTMNIPLEGGAVTGTVSGTCEGPIKANNAGGVITGSMAGVCAPFFVNIPASAVFSGTVNKGGKTVPVSFNGRGGGISHEGATTLTYP